MGPPSFLPQCKLLLFEIFKQGVFFFTVSHIFSDLQAVDVNMYVEACKFDCCGHDSDACMCKSMEAYSRACMDKGVALRWRRNNRCREYIFFDSTLDFAQQAIAFNLK